MVGHKENGDSIFRYIYADTQKELTAMFRQNIDIYQGIDLMEQSRMTLAEWLEQWLPQISATLRPSTLEHYRRDMENHVAPCLGKEMLSTIIGHVSSSTTLNVYAHITDEMRRTAVVKIDQGIGKADPQTETEATPRKPDPSTFHAHNVQRRKAGTGCVTQINEKLWEGRYSPVYPNGKKHARNVYTHSKAECEKLLADMVVEMKAEIAAEKERLKSTLKAG